MIAPSSLHLIEPDESIDFWHLLAQFLAKSLRHAATDDQFLPGLFPRPRC